MKILLLSVIKAYKFLLSPLLPGSCRFVPSCSDYAAEAVSRYGAVKGCYLSVKRVLRCNPWHPGGFDPVR